MIKSIKKFDDLKLFLEGIATSLKTDIDGIKTDIGGVKEDIVGIKTDIESVKLDVAVKSEYVEAKLREVIGGVKDELIESVDKV